jgi:hypothetical protein
MSSSGIVVKDTIRGLLSVHVFLSPNALTHYNNVHFSSKKA